MVLHHGVHRMNFYDVLMVMSMMVSFVLSFFPRDVLDEILNLIGSVSEGFPSYSFIKCTLHTESFFELTSDWLVASV